MNIYAIAICDTRGEILPSINTVPWPRTESEYDAATDARLGEANELTIAKADTVEGLTDLVHGAGGELLALWICEQGKTPIPGGGENRLWTRATNIPVETDAPWVSQRDAQRLSEFLTTQCPRVFGWGDVEFS